MFIDIDNKVIELKTLQNEGKGLRRLYPESL